MKWWERVSPDYIAKNTDGSPEQAVALTYANRLHDLLTETNQFPNSTHEKNLDILLGQTEPELLPRYTQKLAQYESTRTYDRARADFQNHGINIGYKMHLNVPIAHVRRVSDYLRRERFSHKYLSGGEILDGKIFTVYTGSRTMTEKMAAKISADLAGALKRPLDHNDEREMAPNISGRFNVNSEEFTKYGHGLKGIPMLYEDAVRLLYTKDPDARQKIIDLAFKKAFIKLKDQFGDYFYGS